MSIKVIATIGPSSNNYEVIYDLIKHGVSGFRINFAFGNPSEWHNIVENIRKASRELDTIVSIMGDIPGPQTRTENTEAITVKKGDFITITLESKKQEFQGEKILVVSKRELFDILTPGDTILYGDGEVEMRVVEFSRDYAKCLVVTPGVLKPGRKIVVPRKDLPTGFLTSSDIELIKYACSEEFTYIALSYVRSEKDVLLVRDLLAQLNCSTGVISKIETRGGFSNLEKIVEASDAILVARGDLGVHFPIELIPVLQDKIIKTTVKHGKPVIVATDILESMIENNRPSRSDVVGLYNIVHSLADAILLTSETAIGKYPVETIKWAKTIISAALNNLPHSTLEEFRKELTAESLMEKYAQGLIHLAESLHGTIIAYTKTGNIIPLLSRYRPLIPVYMGSWNRKLLEKSTIYYGVNPVDLSSKLVESDDYEKGVEEVYSKLKTIGYLKIGDIVVKSYSKRGINIHEIRVEIVV